VLVGLGGKSVGDSDEDEDEDDEYSQEKANIIFSINTELIGARESVRERGRGRIVK